MPTLVDLDSFQHQVLRVNGPWYSITDTGTTIPSHGGSRIIFDTGAPRTANHVCSIKISHSSTLGTQVRRSLSGGPISVVSFYFKTTDATNPAGRLPDFFQFGAPSNGLITLETDGTLGTRVGACTRMFSAADVCDGNWHRVDARYDCTTTAGTMDCMVDGVALTQATGTVTAGSLTNWNLGGTAAQLANYDTWYSDLVLSSTSADYPIGDHFCGMMLINATGTHSKGTSVFSDQAGVTTDAALLAAIDDAWDGTTPELSQTGEDHIEMKTNAGASNYVEHTLASSAPTMSAIWAAELSALMAALDSATADNCECRLVDAAGTTLATTGLVDPSVSATSYNGYRNVTTVAPSGGWSQSTLNTCKVRWGYSTDISPVPVLNAAMVEFAGVVAVAAPGPASAIHKRRDATLASQIW